MFDPNMFDFDPDITIPDLSGMIPDLSGMILASLPDMSSFAPKLDLAGSMLNAAYIPIPDLSGMILASLPDMSGFTPKLDLAGSMLNAANIPIPDLSGMILASLPDISGFAPKLDLVGSVLGTANITMPDLSLILETVSPLPDMSSFAPTLDLVGSMLDDLTKSLDGFGEMVSGLVMSNQWAAVFPASLITADFPVTAPAQTAKTLPRPLQRVSRPVQSTVNNFHIHQERKAPADRSVSWGLIVAVIALIPAYFAMVWTLWMQLFGR
jgi:hypothetical protein